MKKDVIVADAPVTIGGTTLTPLVKQSYTWMDICGVLSFTAIKHPVYIIISCQGRSRLLDMLGQDVSIHQAKLEYPGLDVVP